MLNDLTFDDWQTIDTVPALMPKEVQVWRIDLIDIDRLLETCMGCLSAEENLHADGLRHIRARQQFVISRGCLRLLLSAACKVEPSLIPLTKGPHGKPEAATLGISFNLAHSKDTILIALCLEGIVGIDIEHLNSTIDFIEVAQLSFTPRECTQLASIDDRELRLQAFYRYWTQKEALLKADGRGLSLPMSSFEIPFTTQRTTPIYLDSRVEPLFVIGLPMGPDAAAAIALDSNDRQLRLRMFPPEAFGKHAVGI